MLTKLHRLTEEKQFAFVYKKGLRTRGQVLSVIVSRNNQNSSRFGFVVAKKDVAKSVARNRLKRILRAQISAHLKILKSGYDVIIQGRSSAQKVRPAEIRAELTALLKRAKLL